ncbi:MAG: hypothetical protein RIS82_429 [Actinomycetota bacterium]|jgi:uncharacterized protein (DUF1778 family)
MTTNEFEDISAIQTVFIASDQQFEEFETLLNEPPRAPEGLVDLASRKAPWE